MTSDHNRSPALASAVKEVWVKELATQSRGWQKGKAPIVRFVTDDEKVVGMMFADIMRTYKDQIVKALMVSGPAGVVLVRGPRSRLTTTSSRKAWRISFGRMVKKSRRCCITHLGSRADRVGKMHKG